MRNIWIVTLLSSVFLCGCNSDSKQLGEDQFGDKLSLDRIDNSQGGIIDDYSFYQKYPEFMDSTVNAVGAISIYKTDGEHVSSGVGLHIKEINTNAEFILTAAHVIYDIKSHERKGDRIKFGHKTDGQKIIQQIIKSIPDRYNYNFKIKDWVFIPVNPQKNRSPLTVDLRSNYFKPNSSLAQKYDGYFLSISSTVGNEVSEDVIEVVRFVSKSDNLYEKSETQGFAFTDLDSIKGMSGSPIFYVSEQKMQLIGLLTTRSLVKNCENIVLKICANKVTLLPAIHKITE